MANTEVIRYNQKELLKLLDWSVSVMYDKFGKTKMYPKILSFEKQKKGKDLKPLDYGEQEKLAIALHACFAPFLENLQKFCSCLTKLERLICCLALRFSPLTISLCMGYENTDCFKTHKSRIKKKMVELSDYAFLFDFIFKQNNREF